MPSFDLQKDTNLAQWDSYTCNDDSLRDPDIISAASREWPLATRMARKVSTREDLTAGSDESVTPLVRATSWVRSGWPLTYNRMGSSWDSSRSSGNQEAVSCRGAIRIIWTPGNWATICRTWGTILNGGKAYRRPLPLSQGTDMASVHSPWGPDMAMQTWWVVCWQTPQTSRPVVCPTGQILVRDALWPLSTPCSVSGRLWTGNLPRCCGILVDGREPKLSPCDRTISAGAAPSAWVCKITCPPRSWCKPLSLRCRTSSIAPGTSDKEGSLSRHWWRLASPERWCAMIFEMLTTVPVSSVSLTGLPSPNWTHPWRVSLPFPWWREEDPVGLLEMPTMPSLTVPTEELWSCQTSSWSLGTELWRPTTGPEEGGVFPVEPV